MELRTWFALFSAVLVSGVLAFRVVKKRQAAPWLALLEVAKRGNAPETLTRLSILNGHLQGAAMANPSAASNHTLQDLELVNDLTEEYERSEAGFVHLVCCMALSALSAIYGHRSAYDRLLKETVGQAPDGTNTLLLDAVLTHTYH